MTVQVELVTGVQSHVVLTSWSAEPCVPTTLFEGVDGHIHYVPKGVISHCSKKSQGPQAICLTKGCTKGCDEPLVKDNRGLHAIAI